jgi:hypothetical protein
MMIDWIECSDSTRVVAVAYDEDLERIFVRFSNGTEWQYHGCPPMVWDEFTSPQTSKGTFINEQLNHHQHGPLVD